MKPFTKVVLFLIAVAALYYATYNPQAVISTRPPDCVFPETGGTCTVNFVLPQDRSAALYQFQYEFTGAPSTVYSSRQTIQPIQTINANDQSASADRFSDLQISLFSMPPSWIDIYDVKVESTVQSTSSCSRSENAYVDNEIYAPTFAYPYDVLNICTSSSFCASNMIVNEYRDGDGDDRTAIIHSDLVAGLRLTSCFGASSTPTIDTNTQTVTGTFPAKDVFGTSTTKPFIVYKTTVDGGGSASIQSKQVYVSYRKALYPTNVQYSIGTKQIETLNGVQRTNATSLDVADQINDYCNRPLSKTACTVALVLKSSTGGSMWVDHTETLKLSDGTVAGQGVSLWTFIIVTIASTAVIILWKRRK